MVFSKLSRDCSPPVDSNEGLNTAFLNLPMPTNRVGATIPAQHTSAGQTSMRREHAAQSVREHASPNVIAVICG